MLRALLLAALAISLNGCLKFDSKDPQAALPGQNPQPETPDIERPGTDNNLGGSTGGTESEPQKPVLPTVLKNVTTFAVAGLPFSYQLDSKSRTVTEFNALSLPAWASLNKQTGLITGTPSAADVSASVSFSVELVQEDQRLVFVGSLAVLHSSALADSGKIDFYDQPFDGHARPYRNDLTGALAGEVQFVQTHAMAPEHAVNFLENKDDQTKSQYMPDIVALRDALLLFIPAKGNDPVTVHVTVTSPNKPTLSLSMAHPNDLPGADKTTELTYSKRAWSVRLPWDYVVNGLALSFVTDKDAKTALSGTLPAEKISIDRATEIVFYSTRIGMLMPPPGKNDGYWTLQDPIMAATDYFQTLPASKVVMASYGDYELTQTIVNQNGKARVYDKAIDKHSDSHGDVYSGDMRSDVSKSQVSIGINMANTGFSSWNLSQGYPKAQMMITNHHALGMYSCVGEKNCPDVGYWGVEHGLSGGNGMGTIIATQYNEASHEWGHAYGLGHWPASNLTPDCRWADHHATTGWGYIGHRNRLRNSVYGIANGGESRARCQSESLVYQKGDLMFSRDAMSGGSYGNSPLSRYTFYTSQSARNIQQHLNGYAIPDTAYASGYKQWDTTLGAYKEVKLTLNSQPAPVPVKVGVPVITILGGYDPKDDLYTDADKRAVIYPAFHANYGNLFDLPAPDLASAADQCWVEVRNTANQSKRVALNNARHSGGINQLHFNLEASFNPSEATLNCRRAGVVKVLAHTQFDTSAVELPPLAVVGQDQGADLLKVREMAEISAAVQALAPDRLYKADANLLLKIQSYSDQDLQEGLTGSVWGYVQQIKQQHGYAQRISSLLNYWQMQQLSNDEQGVRLKAQLQSWQLLSSPEAIAVAGKPLTNNGWYLATELDSNGRLPVREVAKGGSEKAHWVMDAMGKLHPAQNLTQCLVFSGDILALASCDPQNTAQQWTVNAKNVLRNVGSNMCIDNATSKGYPIRYGCHEGWNQQWAGVTHNNELWLSLLPAATMQRVLNLVKP